MAGKLPKRHHLSKGTLLKLKDELEFLIKKKRREIAERLSRARDYGDITDNSEFEVALEEQAFVEGRIAELQDILRRSLARKESLQKSSGITVGSEVKVQRGSQVREFTLTSLAVGNPSQGEISEHSPLGQALLGREIGEEIEVKTPTGTVKYKILGID
jgi:transcription elongation factor GreA